MSKLGTLLLIACTTAAAIPSVADGQSMAERLKKRAEEAAKRKIDQQDKTKAEAKTVIANDTTTTTPATDDKGATPAAAPEKIGEGAFINFDFVPGERVIFAEDFTKDNVGDFPRRLEFQKGNAEVAEWKGARYLRCSEWCELFIPLPETLPERFTMEFDMTTSYKATGGAWFELWFQEASKDYYDQTQYGSIHFGYNEAGLVYGKINADGKYPKAIEDQFIKARIMVDGKYAKVYVDGQRVANVPNAVLGRSNKIRVVIPSRGAPMFVGNIRIAAGGKKLYDAIAEKGRVATQGIYFDTNSDRIRPESAPTLKEIAAMLTEHSDLSLTIEGHTDNVGQAAANLSLSEKRAAAVKQALVSTYGVDAARLTAKGLGATKPAASNDTPEGRQQNRRVELVKS